MHEVSCATPHGCSATGHFDTGELQAIIVPKKVPFFTNMQLKPSLSSGGLPHHMKMWPKMHMYNYRLIFPGAKAQAADVRFTMPRLEYNGPSP